MADERIVIGMSFDEGQREYHLTPEDVRAALEFAAELVEQAAPSAPELSDAGAVSGGR